MIRITEELKNHSHAVFFTLTYNQDSVPKVVNKTTGEIYLSNSPKDIQYVMKRFREKYFKEKGHRFTGKYFITSEYGPKTFRPHIHGIFFGLSLNDYLEIFKPYWENEYGFGTQRKICLSDTKDTFNSSRYVAKYCAKGQFENPLVSSKSVLKNYKLVSKGLGLSYVAQNIARHLGLNKHKIFTSSDDYYQYVLDNYNISFNSPKGVFTYSLPKYYKDKIFSNDAFKSKFQNYLCKVYDNLYNEQLEVIQTQRLCSINEAVNILHLQTLELQRIADNQAREQLIKFYEKSKF